MDDSANRLLNILRTAKHYENRHSAAISAWKEIFGIDDDNLVTEKLGALYVLASKVAQQIVNDNPEAKGIATHIRSCILNIYRGRLDEPWSKTASLIDTHTINYLSAHARIASVISNLNIIEREKFDKAKECLDLAISEIKKSDLPIQIKSLIIKRISEIISAIENYVITGQDEVFDRFKLAVFDLKDEFAKEDLPGKEKMKERRSLIADLLQIGTVGYALSSPIRQMLEVLSP